MTKLRVYSPKTVKQVTLKVYFLAMIITLIGLTVLMVSYRKMFPEDQVFEKPKPVLSHIPGLTRLLCIVPYFLPLLESFDHFAGRIMADYPQDLVRKYKLMFRPIVEFYTQNRLVNFVSFLMLYFLLVSSKSPIRVHPFLRYNTLQALLTFLVTTILGVAFRIFPKEIKRSIYGGIISNTFFLTVAYIIVYALIQALRGKYADIPIISEAVRIQINSKGI